MVEHTELTWILSSYQKVAYKKCNAYLFTTYLLKIYYMSETIPDTGYVAGTNTDKSLFFSQESIKGLLKEESLAKT